MDHLVEQSHRQFAAIGGFCRPWTYVNVSIPSEVLYRETWGQTGRTPITSSRSGKDKSNPNLLVCLERIIPVSFFLWLGCRVS
jgi:hypothetical protein